MSLDINMDDGTILQYTIRRCMGNTIYSLATLSGIVPIPAIITITKL